MQMDEKTYHLIDQYLQGELSGRALDEFKVRLKNPEFHKAVEQQRAIINAVQDVRKRELKQYITENKKSGYIQNQWGSKWTYASAAIVLLFVSAFFIIKFFVNQPQTSLSSETESADQELAIVDSGTTQIDSQTLAIEDQAPPNPMELIESELTEEPSSDSVEQIQEDGDGTLESMDESPPITEDATPLTPAEVEIRKDEKLGSDIVLIPTFSPNFDEDNTVGISSARRKAVSKDSGAEADKEEVESVTPEDQLRNLKLNVEYWKSPINFEGYQYQGSVLKLYEIDQNSSVEYIQLDDRLYLKMGKEYYFLEKNGEYNKFVPVTNQTLLKVLNE